MQKRDYTHTGPKDFQNALNALGTLQSNEATIAAWIAQRRDNPTTNLRDEMMYHVEKLNIKLSELSVIHVAGTKGKGSTCAFVENILRESGYKTGLYTSPNLISVCERIRLNGRSISEESFARYFWTCWDRLAETCTEKYPMPSFFRFVTLLGLYVFQEEKVEAAVIEVGVGGRADATNIFDRPVVTGISSLGFDHMNVLGNTLAEIAFEKAGIMKPQAPSFTVPQAESAMEVLQKFAKEVNAPLRIVTPLDKYSLPPGCSAPLKLGLQGDHQRENAALAVALSRVWLESHNRKTKYDPKSNNYEETLLKETLPDSFVNGLQSCFWPGRAQVFVPPKHPNSTFYLDGAHTPESMQACVRWFIEASADQASSKTSNNQQTQVSQNNNMSDSGRPLRVLIFHCGGGREPASLLGPIWDQECGFDYVFFTTFDIFPSSEHPSNVIVRKNRSDNELSWQQKIMLTWQNFAEEAQDTTTQVAVFPTISEAITEVYKMSGAHNVQALITGSLYLVGGSLRVLEYDVK